MIIKANQFDLEHIASSGQCFRMNRIGEHRYGVIAYGAYIELTQLKQDVVDFSCTTEEYDTLWKDYFDLTYEYEPIYESLVKSKDGFLRDAARFGRGLRILKQEPFEVLISFILSQNKNIPAIKKTIEQLCELYGEKREWKEPDGERTLSYYSFPTPLALAAADPKDLRKTGMGYRDAYVLRAAEAIATGALDFNSLINCEAEEAKSQLKTIHGVGDKVANCISLYGLHHLDVYPVDVWIAKTVKEIYKGQFDWTLYQGQAGIVQQYMFYYKRSKSL